MTTTETIDPRTLTDRLGREIFESLFPHGGPEMGAHRADRQVPEEVRLPKVEGPQGVKVDDIVLVVDNESWTSTLDRFSAREALKHHGTWIGRVRKVSPKSIVVDHVREPRRHSFSADLDDFGSPAHKDNGERLMFSHATREIGRIGTLAELREKIAAHPKLDEWRTARAAAIDVAQAENAKAKANREAKEARLTTVKAAIAGLNEIAGEPLVEPLTFSDTVVGVTRWLHEGDFRRLRVYLTGLHALGQLTGAQHEQALKHLDTIIAYAKGEK